MNANDRHNIARVLAGITSDDTLNIINAGRRILENHPEIAKLLSESERSWWEVEIAQNKEHDYET